MINKILAYPLAAGAAASFAFNVIKRDQSQASSAKLGRVEFVALGAISAFAYVKCGLTLPQSIGVFMGQLLISKLIAYVLPQVDQPSTSSQQGSTPGEVSTVEGLQDEEPRVHDALAEPTIVGEGDVARDELDAPVVPAERPSRRADTLPNKKTTEIAVKIKDGRYFKFHLTYDTDRTLASQEIELYAQVSEEIQKIFPDVEASVFRMVICGKNLKDLSLDEFEKYENASEQFHALTRELLPPK